LVHTAPAHGVEDFEVCKQNNITITSCLGACHTLFIKNKPLLMYQLNIIVDGDGRFIQSVPHFAGLDVLGEGNRAVIAKLKEYGVILKEEKCIHKYPYDWRTKKPIIMR